MEGGGGVEFRVAVNGRRQDEILLKDLVLSMMTLNCKQKEKQVKQCQLGYSGLQTIYCIVKISQNSQFSISLQIATFTCLNWPNALTAITELKVRYIVRVRYNPCCKC